MGNVQTVTPFLNSTMIGADKEVSEHTRILPSYNILISPSLISVPPHATFPPATEPLYVGPYSRPSCLSLPLINSSFSFTCELSHTFFTRKLSLTPIQGRFLCHSSGEGNTGQSMKRPNHCVSEVLFRELLLCPHSFIFVWVEFSINIVFCI